MSLTYDLNIDIKIPDFIKNNFAANTKENDSLEETGENDSLEGTGENDSPEETKKYKKRSEKSELDILIDKITKEKKELYEVVSPTLNQFREILPDRLKEWESSPEIFNRYEGDFVGFMLDEAVAYAYEMEQIQRQKFLGAQEEQAENKSIFFIDFPACEEKFQLVDGMFSDAEREQIAEKLYALSVSIFLKYHSTTETPRPYDNDDLWGVIYTGIAKALNTYSVAEGRMNVAFSSWAYSCMNNACLDLLRMYNSKKRGNGMITIPFDDPQSNSRDAKKNDKYNAGSIASLTQEDQIDNISDDVSKKELVQRLYDGMYELGIKKTEVDKRIYVLQAYFGQLFGYPMTLADISRTMGTSISQVTTAFRKGLENMKDSAKILGISPEEVREVL